MCAKNTYPKYFFCRADFLFARLFLCFFLRKKLRINGKKVAEFTFFVCVSPGVPPPSHSQLKRTGEVLSLYGGLFMVKFFSVAANTMSNLLRARVIAIAVHCILGRRGIGNKNSLLVNIVCA